MNSFRDTIKLTQQQLDYFTSKFPIKSYRSLEDLVYEGQIPRAGYLLLSGKITVNKRGRIVGELPVRSLCCLQSLLKDKPLRHQVTIHPNSEVIVVMKSAALELAQAPDTQLLPLL